MTPQPKRERDKAPKCHCGRKTECSAVQCDLRKEPTALPPGSVSTFPSAGRRTPVYFKD